MHPNLNAAMLLVTMLAFCFKFKRYVPDAVFFQFTTDVVLDCMRITFYNNVHCSVIVMSVYAPYVNVMNAERSPTSIPPTRTILCPDQITAITVI